MRIRSVLCAVGVCLISTQVSWAAPIKVNEKNKFYTIQGKTAPEFAVAMSKRGPYSRQHRKRAWATASRDLTYQLVRKRDAKGCKITDVKVELDIVYTLPKLRNERAVSKRHRSKWRRMFNLLSKHEKVHGKLYKQFARNVRREILRMPRASSCRKLDRQAIKIVKTLSEKDSLANDRFDLKDRRNYSLMERIYTGS